MLFFDLHRAFISIRNKGVSFDIIKKCLENSKLNTVFQTHIIHSIKLGYFLMTKNKNVDWNEKPMVSSLWSYYRMKEAVSSQEQDNAPATGEVPSHKNSTPTSNTPMSSSLNVEATPEKVKVTGGLKIKKNSKKRKIKLKRRKIS